MHTKCDFIEHKCTTQIKSVINFVWKANQILINLLFVVFIPILCCCCCCTFFFFFAHSFFEICEKCNLFHLNVTNRIIQTVIQPIYCCGAHVHKYTILCYAIAYFNFEIIVLLTHFLCAKIFFFVFIINRYVIVY